MKKWTKQDIQWLRDNINRYTNRELINLLGRSKASILGAQYRFNIFRSPEVKEKRLQESYFKKGNVPVNKGIKGIRLSPATEFKKGHLPHNTKYNGAISVRKHKRTGLSYKYIRIAQGKWMLLNRYNWEKHTGKPVPPGHIVGFKDGDALNCEPENLYCISKAENAQRNQDHKKTGRAMREHWKNGTHLKHDSYIASCISRGDKELRNEVLKNPELIELKRTQLKLKRAIANAEQE